jgi:hypothetical protein
MCEYGVIRLCLFRSSSSFSFSSLPIALSFGAIDPVPASYSDELPAFEAVWVAIWATTESQGKGLGHFYVPESEFLPRRQKEKQQVPDHIEQQNRQWILKGKGQDEVGDRIILVKEDVCSILREEWDKAQRSSEKKIFNRFKARYWLDARRLATSSMPSDAYQEGEIERIMRSYILLCSSNFQNVLGQSS